MVDAVSSDPAVPRRFRPTDHDAVAEVMRGAYAEHVRDEPEYMDQLTDLARRDREAEVWVVDDDDGRPVATVTVCPPGSSYREVAASDELEFRMLAVSPEAQGRGLGRLLTQTVIHRARELGLASVVLSSTGSMSGAHRLYGSLGFVRVPERDWAPHLPLLVFRLELS